MNPHRRRFNCTSFRCGFSRWFGLFKGRKRRAWNMSLKAKLDWFSIVYLYSKKWSKTKWNYDKILNKLIIYLKFYSLPSILQGALNGLSLECYFIWFQREFNIKRESWKCKFLNSKPLSDRLSFGVQLDEVRLGKLTFL